MDEKKDFCYLCDAELGYYDIIAYRKFVSRDAEEYLCMSCLARRFDTTVDELKKRLEYFRKQGCTLFSRTTKNT